MSLAQLLTVGRSFRGGKDGPNDYRMSVQPLLPKFQAPALGMEGRETSGPGTQGAAIEATEATEASRVEPLTAATFRPGPILTATAPVEKPKLQLTRREEAAVRAAGLAWWQRLAFWRQPVLSAPPGRMRQQRLCLDDVHVVRNDLFEADLEVVTTRSKDRGTPQVRESRTSRQGSSWVLLSVRFWNSQRNRF